MAKKFGGLTESDARIGGHKYGEFGPTGTNGHHKYSGPTVHNGWTAEPARRSESDARINRARGAAAVTQLAPIVK